MDKLNILTSLRFGESIAEQEASKLKDYFLKTEYWNSVRNGSVDIVYGAKGAGKSAIYTSITNDVDSLFDEGTLVALAENPSGNTAFSSLTTDPPTSEKDFIRLWKLYFLVITASVFKEYGIEDKNSQRVSEILVDCNLIPAQNKLARILKSCFDFVKSFKNGKEVSTTAEFDPITGGYCGQKFSITFGEQSKHDFEKGLISIEYVYDLLSKSLDENKIKLWVVIDRLDVAFLESEILEANALRALFKAYLDLSQFSNIGIKIFLRDDIWKNITAGGFREASHITKFQSINWTRDSLLNLIIRRILDNNDIVTEYNVDKMSVMASIKNQEEFFYRVFPMQVDVGSRKSKTLEWIISRTKDGKGINTPREIIQLLNHARTSQIKRLENGVDNLQGEILISSQAIKEAVELVSKQRLEQTIYAEYPDLKEYIELLRGDKAEQSFESLKQKWSINDASETLKIIKKLINIGFFEEKGDQVGKRYKIPFIYRPFLDIVQGSIVEDGE